MNDAHILIGLNDWNYKKPLAVFPSYSKLQEFVDSERKANPDTQLLFYAVEVPYDPDPVQLELR